MGLTDDKNLNREFPGDPQGTEMERLAWAVSQELQPVALLAYLKDTDIESYRNLIERLGLRK